MERKQARALAAAAATAAFSGAMILGAVTAAFSDEAPKPRMTNANVTSAHEAPAMATTDDPSTAVGIAPAAVPAASAGQPASTPQATPVGTRHDAEPAEANEPKDQAEPAEATENENENET